MKSHKENNKKIIRDIAKLLIKRKQYPQSFKAIEDKYGLSKLYVSFFYLTKKRSEINEEIKKQTKRSNRRANEGLHKVEAS